MPIARVQLEDGRIARFDVPEGTTPEEVEALASRLAEPPAAVPQQEVPRALAAPEAEEAAPLQSDIVKRGVLLPFGETREGETELALPEIAVDLIRALKLPGQALEGVPITEEDLLNAAATITPGAVRGAGVVGRTVRTALEGAAPEAGQAAVFRGPGVRRTVPSQEQAAQRSATETARAQRFAEQEIPATRADITQEFAQQAEEQRLISMATGEAGEPLRQAKLTQSEAFIRSVNDFVDSLGVPGDTGDSVKAALTGRKKLLRKEKNALYKEVADAAPEVANVPIFTDEIIEALPAEKELRRLRRLSPNTVDAVDDLLIEFGINKNPVDVDNFIRAGGEVTPLNLRNSEDFRQALGQIDRADQTGATKVVTGPIRNALDEEAAFIDDAIKESGVTDEGILTTLREARARVRTLKTEFSPQAITGRLIDTKRDGVTPIIEASKVTQTLLRPGSPIENLERTMKSLLQGGPKGKRALQDLRASVVMDALEAALKAPSRKTSGIETVGGNQFAKALSKFGDEKLDLLFRGNEGALKKLRNLKQTALDISPAAGAVPRGSAPVILDIMKRVGRVPGIAAAVDAVTFVVKAGADDRAVAAAINAKPAIKQTLVGIRRDFPTIAERLGLLTILQEAETLEPGEELRRAGGA